MNDRSIGNIENFGHNVNFQGDDVKQINVEINTELDNALKELVKEISKIEDDTEKDNADMHYEMLVKSIQENKPSRIKSCLNVLKGTVGTTASILTISSQLGII